MLVLCRTHNERRIKEKCTCNISTQWKFFSLVMLPFISISIWDSMRWFRLVQTITHIDFNGVNERYNDDVKMNIRKFRTKNAKRIYHYKSFKECRILKMWSVNFVWEVLRFLSHEWCTKFRNRIFSIIFSSSSHRFALHSMWMNSFKRIFVWFFFPPISIIATFWIFYFRISARMLHILYSHAFLHCVFHVLLLFDPILELFKCSKTALSREGIYCYEIYILRDVLSDDIQRSIDPIQLKQCELWCNVTYKPIEFGSMR